LWKALSILLHHARVISCIIAVGGHATAQLLLLWSASRAASASGNSTANDQFENDEYAIEQSANAN
jgi:hypothetical protein